MVQYNNWNVKLYDLQLNKLKSGIKYGTQVTSNYSSDTVHVSNDTTNFPYKLLLFNTHVLKIRKTCKLFIS